VKRRPGILGPLGPPDFLAAAGVGVATFGIPDAGSPFAIPLVGGLGIFLTFLAAGLHRDRETGQFLEQWREEPPPSPEDAPPPPPEDA